MGKIIGEGITFDDVLLVACADDKIVKPVMRVALHDMPKDGHATELDHWFWLELAFLADACTISACQQNNFHQSIAPFLTSCLQSGYT